MLNLTRIKDFFYTLCGRRRFQVFRELRHFLFEGLQLAEGGDIIDRDETTVVVLAGRLNAKPESRQQAR